MVKTQHWKQKWYEERKMKIKKKIPKKKYMGSSRDGALYNIIFSKQY